VVDVPTGTFTNTTGTVTSANGGQGNAASATLQVLAQPLIPTLNEWTLTLLALMLSAATFLALRKRRH